MLLEEKPFLHQAFLERDYLHNEMNYTNNTQEKSHASFYSNMVKTNKVCNISFSNLLDENDCFSCQYTYNCYFLPMLDSQDEQNKMNDFVHLSKRCFEIYHMKIFDYEVPSLAWVLNDVFQEPNDKRTTLE